jgi:biotin carboxyl carrier protein
MTNTADKAIDWLIEYFHRSGFEYLALDYAGHTLRLSRASASHEDRVGAQARAVVATSIGFIAKAKGRERYPRSGDTVAEGEPLFAIRRFRNAVEVTAPAAGTLATLSIEDGAFVQYGEPLATIIEMHEP